MLLPVHRTTKIVIPLEGMGAVFFHSADEQNNQSNLSVCLSQSLPSLLTAGVN